MGHCPSMGLSSYGLRTILDAMLGGWPQRDMIPALIYRIDRCDEEDVEAVFSFYDVIFGSGSKGQDNSFSYVLHYNEVFSELWEHPLFADNQQLLEYLDKVYLYPLIGYEKGYDRNELYLKWPKYDAPLDDIWAQTDIPMLMLQGQMDPVTPYESAKTMTSHFAGKHQTFVTFPYATHNVISGTPMDKPIESEHCAKNIFDQFIHDPEAALDTDCVDDAIPPDFEGQPWAPYVFGTQDYWENVPVKSGEMPSEVRDTLTESARRMNEMLRQKGFERRFDQPQR